MTSDDCTRVRPNSLPYQTRPEKIHSRHCERLAIVYIRQSTPQQVERHQESTRLQYALVERACQFGWSRDAIVVIDDDLGHTGSTVEGRLGFQRLVAEVSLGRVGLVLGIEMSRLARSCLDWHQLLEICAVFDTLIADPEGVYDPGGCYNDRLLLGLKATMSEAELHILKARMLEARMAKARRGELGKPVPMGYVRRPSGEIILDPDEQAQATIRLVFELYQRFGTIGKVLRHLTINEIRMPVHAASGQNKGELEWRRPNRPSLYCLLVNPIYAGAYVYGLRPTDRRRQKPGHPKTGRKSPKLDNAAVVIPDRVPAYITWDQYQENQARLRANAARLKGPVRAGSALLSGLLICGRCGLRMNSAYNNNGHAPRYQCGNMRSTYDEPLCQSLAAAPLDRLIADLVLAAVQPAAIEVSLAVAADVELSAQRWSGIGGKVWNGRPMPPSERIANTRPWNPKTDWWPARLSGRGKKRWRTRRDWKPIMSDVGASSRRRRASRKSPRYKLWLRTCRLCGAPKQQPRRTVRPSCVCSWTVF
jgi:DNA invertase Pin-like site-specific DNA recombinase